MKLPDFLTFVPFNQLRTEMGATELGAFEFFDPRLHLTAGERERLQAGVGVPWSSMRCLHDYTLAYKNSRVLLWADAPGQSWAAPNYHLAYCRSLQRLRRERPQLTLTIATQLPPPEPWPWRVCPECLQQLQFKGYDAARARHRDYSDRIIEAFDLEEFFAVYPSYPVNTKVLRALESVA